MVENNDLYLDPLYNEYQEIFNYYMYGTIIHSRMVLRLSNDVMFVSYNDNMKALYHEITGIYVLLETLNGLLKDNPLFSCGDSVNNIHINDGVTENVRKKYEGIFSRLLGCLKTRLSKLDNSYKKGLDVNDIDCTIESSVGTGPGNSSGMLGDYSPLDYNNDYFVEI